MKKYLINGIKFDVNGFETYRIGNYYITRLPGVLDFHEIYASVTDKLRFYERVSDPELCVTILVREISIIEVEQLIVIHTMREPEIFRKKLKKLVKFCNDPHIAIVEKIKKVKEL